MKKENKKQIIGILGGMGPQASAHLVTLLVEMSAKEFGAKDCDGFPEIVLDSVPILDFISDKKNKKIGLTMFKERVRRMSKMQIGMLAISCNTAHILLNQLQLVSKVPFISMIDAIAKEVGKCGIKKVGLLASPITLKSDLFQKAIGPERKVYLSFESRARGFGGNYQKGYCWRD